MSRLDLHRAIRHPLWSSAPDEELARDHGVTAQEVRELRDQIDRDVLCVEVLSYAREISAAHPGYTLGEIIRLTMRAAARRAGQMQRGDDSPARSSGSRPGRAGTPAGRQRGMGPRPEPAGPRRSGREPSAQEASSGPRPATGR